MKEFIIRSLVTLVLFVGILFVPWWVVFLGALAACFRFNQFFEIIILGIFYDIWFHIPGISWYHALWHTVLALVLFAIALAAKAFMQKPKFH